MLVSETRHRAGGDARGSYLITQREIREAGETGRGVIRRRKTRREFSGRWIVIFQNHGGLRRSEAGAVEGDVIGASARPAFRDRPVAAGERCNAGKTAAETRAGINLFCRNRAGAGQGGHVHRQRPVVAVLAGRESFGGRRAAHPSHRQRAVDVAGRTGAGEAARAGDGQKICRRGGDETASESQRLVDGNGVIQRQPRAVVQDQKVKRGYPGDALGR